MVLYGMSKKIAGLFLSALLITMCTSCSSPSGGDSGQNPAQLDTDAPTITGSPSVGTSTCRILPISWAAAHDDTTESTNLEYAVYVSISGAMPTLSDAMKNGTCVMDWTASKTSLHVVELKPATIYHIAVFVRDTAGNVTVYPDASAVTTSGIEITWCTYLFPSSIVAKINVPTQVYGQYYVDGITTKPSLSSVIQVELGSYRIGASIDTAKYIDAQFTEQKGNNHEYVGSLSFTSAGTYTYFIRFSGDEGYTWVKSNERTATISN